MPPLPSPGQCKAELTRRDVKNPALLLARPALSMCWSGPDSQGGDFGAIRVRNHYQQVMHSFGEMAERLKALPC